MVTSMSKPLNKVLRHSSMNAVSSAVFLRWLRFDVVLNAIHCHLLLGEYTPPVHSLLVVRFDCSHLILVKLSV